MEPTEPVVVLVEPQMGENIGAAMRAMCNFGLQQMRLVRPRDGWPNAAAVAMATGAGKLLENVQLYDSTESAVADCHAVYVTTARPRQLTKRVLVPEKAMREVRAHSTARRRAALVFGPERTGLLNADVVLAHAIITVPVDPAFPVLNLAQAVLLVCYEWQRSGHDAASARADVPELAEAGKVTRFVQNLIEELDGVNCFFTGERKPAMAESLENMFRRLPLTEHDVRTLWRVVRTLTGKLQQQEKS